jgi:hypothetical protein
MFRFVIMSTTIIIAIVLYAPGSANAARYCARISGAALDCRFETINQCIHSKIARGASGHCCRRDRCHTIR